MQKSVAQLSLLEPAQDWAAIVKTMPRELRRASGVMACGDGWKEFLSAKCEGGKWALQETPLTEYQKNDGYTIAITSEQFYEWAVEYGYSRLKQIFGAEHR